jgi:polysaccharide biosynthesis protein PslH
MRIMMVSPLTPYLPCSDGARLLPAQLLAHLEHHHTFGVVAPLCAEETPAQRAWTASRAAWLQLVPAGRWRHPLTGAPAEGVTAVREAIASAVERFEPDVLHLEGALLAPLARTGGVPTVLSCHESPPLRARDMGRMARMPWARLRAHIDERVEADWERRWFTSVDACVVASEDDRAAVAAHLPFDRVEVIPMGIDARQYSYRREGEPHRIVFTGDFTAGRDADAARRFALSIFPRVRRQWPRAELLIAGTALSPAVRALAAVPGVSVSEAAADLRASVWSAAVYVSPQDVGFGSKARLVEAMALGTPIVASTCSLSGLTDVLPGHHVLTADNDEQFADATTMLMRERVVAHTIAHNARDLVERRYTWRAVTERYDALYARLAVSTPALALAA